MNDLASKMRLLDCYIVPDFSLLVYLLIGGCNRRLLLREYLTRDFTQGECALSIAFKIYFMKKTLFKNK